MSVFRHHMLRPHELHSLVLAEAAGTVGVLCPIAASSMKGGLSERSGISSHPDYHCLIGVIWRTVQGKEHNNGIYTHLRQKGCQSESREAGRARPRPRPSVPRFLELGLVE